jgi:branched-chain amino acid transport system substrate-binding protein
MPEFDRQDRQPLARRTVLKAAAFGAVASGLGAFLAACGVKTSSPSAGGVSAAPSLAGGAAGSSAASGVTPSAAAAIPFTIGFVSPQTGPAAGFGEPDPYIIGLVQAKLDQGFSAGGKAYAVKIVTKDSKSDPATAAQVANDLINSDKVDMILATSTPENNNPVADAAEAAGIPFVCTVEPWESFFFPRQKDPAHPVPFKFTFNFCFGVAEFGKTYVSMWDSIPTNKKVGVMWPNDADGNAIRANLAPLLEKAGYTIIDPGPYEDGTNDYSAQIAKFKAENCEIFNTFPLPPDFATFWKQAAQQGYVPKIAQIAKTGLFPSQIEALGDLGIGLASAAYWTPTFPYSSLFLGTSSADLGTGYTATTGRQWNQDLGTTTALFDVATSAIQAAADPKDKVALAAAIGKLNITTPIGKVDFTSGPFPNVSPAPIIGGQWVKDPTGKFKVDFQLVEHATDPNVPIAGKLTTYR